MKIRFYKTIIFSKTPLKSHFRYKDEFQIYPCDSPEAPQTDRFDFPLFIEFWVDEDEKVEVPIEYEEFTSLLAETSLYTKKLNRIIRLLSAITNHEFSSYPVEVKWGVPMPDLKQENSGKINSQSSRLFMSLYTYSTMRTESQITEFSSQSHKSMGYRKHHDYYLNDPFEDIKKEIDFPDTINSTLEKYYDLESKTQLLVDTICHLIKNGLTLETKMKSLSFLAFVSSIETLINHEYKTFKGDVEFECDGCQTIKSSPVNCKKCGRPSWGISTKFYTFLRTYVAYSEEAVKKFKRVYGMRSKIVHTGVLLLGDEFITWGNSDVEQSQFEIRAETKQLARLSVILWLLDGPNKTPNFESDDKQITNS